jgi:proline dehydrogenase
VKLVRGAYHGHEMAAYDKEDRSANKAPVPPVWGIKSETDGNYHRCARILVDHISDQADIPRFGIMFATHNRKSCDLILEALIEKDLVKPNGDQLDVSPNVGNRIQFAQLYGEGPPKIFI